MNAIYGFQDYNMRIIGTYEDPQFIVKDVCDALGIKNPTQAVRTLPKNWRSYVKHRTSSGVQNMLTVNEAGLYRLIMRSNKSIALKFQEWLCEDVIPSIRKKGRYDVDEEYQRLLKEKDSKMEEQRQELLRMKRYINRKNKHKYPEGNSIYIIHHKAFGNDYKIGMTDNMNKRPKEFETYAPDSYRVVFYRKIREMRAAERLLHDIFESRRCNRGKEWFTFEDISVAIRKIDEVCDSIEALYKDTPRLVFIDDYTTNQNPPKTEIPSQAKKNILLLPSKPCNTCKIVKPLESFFNAKEHRDGKENVCKPCVKIRQQKHIEKLRKENKTSSSKPCNICNETLLLSSFYRDKNAPDGRMRRCNECHKARQKKIYSKPKPIITEKICGSCKVLKPISQFHQRKLSFDGYLNYCKSCIKIKAKIQYQKHRDTILRNKATKRKSFTKVS